MCCLFGCWKTVKVCNENYFIHCHFGRQKEFVIKKAYFVSCSRMPQLFTKDIALVQQFFESMCKVRDGKHSEREKAVLLLRLSLPSFCCLTPCFSTLT